MPGSRGGGAGGLKNDTRDQTLDVIEFEINLKKNETWLIYMIIMILDVRWYRI